MTGAELERERGDLREEALYQKDLVIEFIRKYRNEKTEAEITYQELENGLSIWTSDGYSKTWRFLVDKQRDGLEKGQSMDYSKITLAEVERVGREKGFILKKAA